MFNELEVYSNQTQYAVTLLTIINLSFLTSRLPVSPPLGDVPLIGGRSGADRVADIARAEQYRRLLYGHYRSYSPGSLPGSHIYNAIMIV